MEESSDRGSIPLSSIPKNNGIAILLEVCTTQAAHFLNILPLQYKYGLGFIGMERDALMVEGFVFPSMKEAQIALKEQKNIEVIRERTEFSNPEDVYGLYVKLLERNMFKTIIGYSFLYELRHTLITEFSYDEQELPVIHLPKNMEYDKVSRLNQGVMEMKIQQLQLVKKRMSIVIAALAFMVIAMFVIAAVNPNVGYVNTERKVVDKYSAWQENLEQREQAVKEKEKELNIDSEE